MSTNGVRHFLDLTEISKTELRAMIEASRAMKAKLKRKGATEKNALKGEFSSADTVLGAKATVDLLRRHGLVPA